MTGKIQATLIPGRMTRLSPPSLRIRPSIGPISSIMANTTKPKSRLISHQQTSIFSTNSHALSFVKSAAMSQSAVTFDRIWTKVEAEFPVMRMTGDILWLIGAPGSGKGTVTPYILTAQNTQNEPICMSGLLQTPELKAVVDSGMMVDDGMVLEQLLRALLSRDSTQPLVVDGFPRTQTQVDFVSLLNKKLLQYSSPSFKVAILYVSQETSLARQMKRGIEARLNNARVRLTGKGKLMEERVTDLDEDLVLTRYRTFKKHMSAIMGLSQQFPFHMINADCNINDVVKHILYLFDARYPQQRSAATVIPENPIWHGFSFNHTL
ncbi:hypothetical protein DSO57_1003829 [Entomophthora muscae]|uniref:Uncharacterized protein n=1 Tax=Entomophthora muscae TaxID=34485 RepID=A0ACC2UVA6_9FUNG|nr:hypothetical protein DSO57_1003829 [Entomophthora muscae]